MKIIFAAVYKVNLDLGFKGEIQFLLEQDNVNYTEFVLKLSFNLSLFQLLISCSFQYDKGIYVHLQQVEYIWCILHGSYTIGEKKIQNFPRNFQDHMYKSKVLEN